MTRRLTTAFVALLFATTASACSVSETLTAPHCNASSSSALIAAQSVPDASLLACLDPLPTGWQITTVDIDQDGTRVAFDSDRAGTSAARLRYEESCDIGDATPTPTEFEGTDRYESVIEVDPRFRANRFYLFDGGCVTWEFDFDADAPAAMAVELGNSLQLVDREMVNQDFRNTFIDEDL